MRNLKRALSLLLSSTMVLGMLVMGSSAAGYKDVDASNKNQEAIEVLQTAGIMTGDQNGNFNPGGSITRNEMAVVDGSPAEPGRRLLSWYQPLY